LASKTIRVLAAWVLAQAEPQGVTAL
jgi:hypothetical protein